MTISKYIVSPESLSSYANSTIIDSCRNINSMMAKERSKNLGAILNVRDNSLIVRFWQWLIHLGFRLLYHELAWTYDIVSWLVSLGHWQEWGRASIPFITGTRVLELAHGPGHLQQALHVAGYQSHGIDLSPQMSRLAHQRLRKGNHPRNLNRGEAQYLPFQSSSFDTVVATFPTDFIVDPMTLESARRVLDPNGKLVIVVQGRLLGRGPIYRLIEWLFEITGQRGEPGRDLKDSDIWMEVDKRLEEAGFKMELKIIRHEDSEVTIVIAEKVK